MVVRKVRNQVSLRNLVPISLAVLIAGCVFAPVAHAQGPTPTPPPPPTSNNSGDDKLAIILRLATDALTGKTTTGADMLFEQAKQSISNLVNSPNADIFFLDFGNPNLPLNQFATEVARNLLLLTPLYALGYLIVLVFGIWRERPIPNPILYAALVAGVMFFLAAFALITQGMSQLGRVIAMVVGGTGNAMFARGALLDTIIRILVALQKSGGIFASLALLIATVETIVILIQLVYRGLSMAIWRLIGVLLIPLSVLLESSNPKTAGKVISEFFEAWLDMVGKITLLLIVLSIASSDTFKDFVWLILPAGLLVVVSSWIFLKPLFLMVRGVFERAWKNIASSDELEPVAEISSSAEAARAREIDEERKKLLKE